MDRCCRMQFATIARFLLAASVIQMGAAAGDEASPLFVDPALRASLKEALADDFEFVGDRLGNRLGSESWLVELRPKRAGMLLVGCEFRIRREQLAGAAKQLMDYDRSRFQYLIFIGEKGARRSFVARTSLEPITYLACLGDTVVVPIPMSSSNYDYQFFLRNAENETRLANREDRIKRYVDDPFASFGNVDAGLAVECRSPHMKTVQTRLSAFGCRTARDTSYDINAVLQATGPGRFDLLPNNEIRGERHNLRIIPLAVVPRDQPLRVLVTSVEVMRYTQFRDNPPTWSSASNYDFAERTVIAQALRVGDRVVASCWTRGCTSIVPEFPATAVDEAEFDGAWLWGVEPTDEPQTAERKRFPVPLVNLSDSATLDDTIHAVSRAETSATFSMSSLFIGPLLVLVGLIAVSLLFAVVYNWFLVIPLVPVALCGLAAWLLLKARRN